MKRAVFALALIVATSGLALANYGDVLETFCGRQAGSVIALNWQSGAERGVRTYVIERSLASPGKYREIVSIPANGDQSAYLYSDTLTATHSRDAYKYRLRIIFENRVEFSSALMVRVPAQQSGKQDLAAPIVSGLITNKLWGVYRAQIRHLGWATFPYANYPVTYWV